MRTALWLTAVAVIVLVTAPVFAGDPVLPPKANKELIEKNLLIGLASDNAGLQRSCALMLGKIKADHALIPLMSAMNNSEDEKLRIAAAWALCRIGHSAGTYAVKRAVIFDECCKVQLACAWYYENYVKKGSFTFRQVDLQTLAELPNR